MGPLIGTLRLIVVCSGLRGLSQGIRRGWIFKPPAYQPPPTSMPKPGESIQEYYRRMDGEVDHAMDDAEFVERGYRKPFCTLRLNGSESIEGIQEKEGFGSRE